MIRRAQAELKRVSDHELEGVGLTPVVTRVSADGFFLEDQTGRYDPPWPTTLGGVYQVGKKWAARSIVTLQNGAKTWVDIDARITAREKVTVPLGTFDTFRVDYQFN